MLCDDFESKPQHKVERKIAQNITDLEGNKKGGQIFHCGGLCEGKVGPTVSPLTRGVFFFFSASSLSARVKPERVRSWTLSYRPSCTVGPPHVPSARQAVDSLRLNSAQLLLRLSPQLQEVKGQLLAQTGQPPRLGPPPRCRPDGGKRQRSRAESEQRALSGGRRSQSETRIHLPGVY